MQAFLLIGFTHISEILTTISQINEPITGMFVLILMHFLWWFQIMVMKFHNFDIFYQVYYIFNLSSELACRCGKH